MSEQYYKLKNEYGNFHLDPHRSRFEPVDIGWRYEKLKEALEKIANQDYRGNRSTESQIAFKALEGTK